MPAGRPTKYQDTYCNEVIETMGRGKSLTAFAGDIGVSRSTVNLWREEHEEFSDAVKIGQAKRVSYLEDGLLEAKSGPEVTSRIFALKNAGPDEWKDKQEVTHGVTDSLADLLREIDGRTRGLPNGADNEGD